MRRPRENVLISFGRRIRDLRAKKGWSQEELAFEANIDRSYLSGVECGKRNIALANIDKLAKALGVSARELFTEDIGPSHKARPG